MMQTRNEILDYNQVLSFYKGKRVFITGNTGFKGSWLTHILLNAGAVVTGYSLQPPKEPNLFRIAGVEGRDGLIQYIADVRDLDTMKSVFIKSKPEIVFHLAAQPIVRDSYRDPVTTYSTNVMGTVHVCECVRTVVDSEGRPVVRSFLNVTTDKVYQNNEWEWGYRENDELCGLDPYSNSKSCSELITKSYKNSFFKDGYVRISTVRAGNVIGGGDFSNDRIIPDCIRAVTDMEKRNRTGMIEVRNPNSVRPYQHVLEPLFMYLTVAMKQYEDVLFAGYYNVGPDEVDCVSTGKLTDIFTTFWNDNCVNVDSTEDKELKQVSWISKAETETFHEANYLKLDCSKIKSTFNWRPRWHIEEAVYEVICWTKVWMEEGENKNVDRVRTEMDREIEAYINENNAY